MAIDSRHLFRAMDPHYDKFAALHAACWSGGTVLYVPRGVVIDRPFHTLSALSRARRRFGSYSGGARRRCRGDGAFRNCRRQHATSTALHCGGIELLVGPGANLRYVNLQNWGHGVWHFAHQKGLVDRDGSLQWTIGALGRGWRK